MSRPTIPQLPPFDLSFLNTGPPSPRQNLALRQIVDALLKGTADCLEISSIVRSCCAIDHDHVCDLALLQRHLLCSVRKATDDKIFTLTEFRSFFAENRKETVDEYTPEYLETEKKILKTLASEALSSELHQILVVHQKRFPPSLTDTFRNSNIVWSQKSGLKFLVDCSRPLVVQVEALCSHANSRHWP